MKDFIANKISEIYSSVSTAGNTLSVATPANFNAAMYTKISLFAQNVAMPVAYIILALFLLLELYSVTVRTDGNSGFEIPFRIMFKCAVCKIVIDNTDKILRAIFDVSQYLINGMITTTGSLNALDMEKIKSTIPDDLTVQVMSSAEVIIVSLIVKFALLIVSVIIVGRMLELYVYIAIAPIPLATLPSAEMSSIAKNFLKSVAAVALQGVLIMLVIALFPMLFETLKLGTALNISDALFKAAGYSFVLLIAVFSTGRWAKSICNAM